MAIAGELHGGIVALRVEMPVTEDGCLLECGRSGKLRSAVLGGHMGRKTNQPAMGDRAMSRAASPDAEVFLGCRERLVNYLAGRFGDRELAKDVAQDTMLRALEKRDSFDPARDPWPWLKTIGVHIAIDYIRARGRETTTGEIVGASERPDPADEIAGDIVGAALKLLPQRQRVALSLKYLDDWKSQEVADFLGLSRAAFDQLICRARRRLGIEYRKLERTLRGLLLPPITRVRSYISPRLTDPARIFGGLGLQHLSQMIAAVFVLGAGAQTVPGVEMPIPTFRNVAQAPGSQEEVIRSRPTVKVSEPASPEDSSRDQVPPGSSRESNTIMEDLTDPNNDVREPEDARITSLAMGGKRDRFVYAAGTVHCRTAACPPVLFRSKDGGKSWSRAAAGGLLGGEIVIPREAPSIVFAMGPLGLQISRDKGQTFSDVLPTGVPATMGSIAVSPLFTQGDPTVLIGAQTLLRYSDRDGSVLPYPASLTGPFEPSYSPAFASDSLFLLGGLRQGEFDGLISVLSICNPTTCHTRQLPARDQIPKIRTAGDEQGITSVYAFTQDDLFANDKNLIHYRRVDTPWDDGTLVDLEVTLDDGLVVATVGGYKAQDAGIYISDDGAKSWERVPGKIVDNGADDIVLSHEQILVALPDAGLACSSDGGRTFTRRCRG